MQVQPPGEKLQTLEPGHVPPHEPMPPSARHGPGTHSHAPVSGSASHRSNSDGQKTPPQRPSGPKLQSGGKSVVVVELEVLELVVVAQPPAPHASQQLENDPTQALPPFGAMQRSAPRLTAHDVFPELLVRQHVTEPGLPHVDFEAQRFTTRAQPSFTSVAAAVSTAQRT